MHFSASNDIISGKVYVFKWQEKKSEKMCINRKVLCNLAFLEFSMRKKTLTQKFKQNSKVGLCKTSLIHEWRLEVYHQSLSVDFPKLCPTLDHEVSFCFSIYEQNLVWHVGRRLGGSRPKHVDLISCVSIYLPNFIELFSIDGKHTRKCWPFPGCNC